MYIAIMIFVTVCLMMILLEICVLSNCMFIGIIGSILPPLIFAIFSIYVLL